MTLGETLVVPWAAAVVFARISSTADESWDLSLCRLATFGPLLRCHSVACVLTATGVEMTLVSFHSCSECLMLATEHFAAPESITPLSEVVGFQRKPASVFEAESIEEHGDSLFEVVCRFDEWPSGWSFWLPHTCLALPPGVVGLPAKRLCRHNGYGDPLRITGS